MGFLKKSNAPSELPDLAIEGLGDGNNVRQFSAPVSQTQPAPAFQSAPPVQPVVAPQPIQSPVVPRREVAGEDYLEFPHDAIPGGSNHDEIKKTIDDNLLRGGRSERVSKSGFFDQVLNDINGEIKDLGNIEDWYEKKFLKQDVVSNMKGYWEENKADIIIESFGAEYKRQINEKVKVLQELEEDWREIYFRLVKKEEEMKKEERELKETLSEFVNLCKRRKGSGEGKK